MEDEVLVGDDAVVGVDEEGDDAASVPVTSASARQATSTVQTFSSGRSMTAPRVSTGSPAPGESERCRPT
ncbi:hypothetical protein [Pseudonocardia sp. N23]|uniref:hypothetical protein n=1 Tax=Pseudonocardia sp. N23 TaxID=1987376 RepID=UPI00209BBBFE|nr:hypothetical protein [Pseudonocardia sp. N23]